MAPLYPILSPRIFTAPHLPLLTSRESLLLASMITISARYSSLPSAPRARAIHSSVADYIRDELIGLLDGSGELRHISSVEALLLLTEWPPITDGRSAHGRGSGTRLGKRKRGWGGGADGDESGEGESGTDSVEDAEALLRSSAQYDGCVPSFLARSRLCLLAPRLPPDLLCRGQHELELHWLCSPARTGARHPQHLLWRGE